MLCKKAAILFLATTALLSSLLFAALYVYDPMAVFHLPYARELMIADNMRQQNIALIRHLEFDSLIMGNSYTENTSAKDAGEQLGGRFVNLSMSGSNLYERSLILDYVLRHRRIKTVFGLLTEVAGREGYDSYPLSEWAFLYDENYLNDFKVYLNRRYLACLATWSDAPKCTGKKVDLDRPAAWFQRPDHASRFGGLDNWIRHHENEQLAELLHEELPQMAATSPLLQAKGMTPEAAAHIRATIDEFIVQPARAYPETDFIYFFNPASLLARALEARGVGLGLYAFWVRESTLRCAGLDNVRLYFFDNEPFTEDLGYYKDPGHYSPDINSLILRSVRLGKNRLSPDNVDEQLRLLSERVAAYDIKAVNAYVQEGIRRMKASAAPQAD